MAGVLRTLAVATRGSRAGDDPRDLGGLRLPLRGERPAADAAQLAPCRFPWTTASPHPTTPAEAWETVLHDPATAADRPRA